MNKQFNPHKQGRKYLEKLPFLIYIFHYFEVLFSPSVTLVTAKNQHRCWKARAYARTRRKTQLRPNLPYKQHKIESKKNILSLFP